MNTRSNTNQGRPSKKKIRAIDLFCGAGGCSWGAQKAGVEIVAGFDIWSLAGQVFSDNFPAARFYPGNLEQLRPTKLKKSMGRIDLILASPECTNHSVAKGSRERLEESRETAFYVLKFARILKPRWIVIENVGSMKIWHRYQEFISKLQKLGYQIRQQTLDASKFGVPQARKRLFILCDRERKPSKITPPLKVSRKRARDAVDLNGKHPFSPLRTPRRALSTLERADRAIKALGPGKPFLLIYYGTDKGGGWQTLNTPLRTVTTLDRFALVKPRKEGHKMRMLQVPELQKAMGFNPAFKIRHGNRREKIHLLGNAVCPPVMEAIVHSLVNDQKS